MERNCSRRRHLSCLWLINNLGSVDVFWEWRSLGQLWLLWHGCEYFLILIMWSYAIEGSSFWPNIHWLCSTWLWHRGNNVLSWDMSFSYVCVVVTGVMLWLVTCGGVAYIFTGHIERVSFVDSTVTLNGTTFKKFWKCNWNNPCRRWSTCTTTVCNASHWAILGIVTAGVILILVSVIS